MVLCVCSRIFYEAHVLQGKVRHHLSGNNIRERIKRDIFSMYITVAAILNTSESIMDLSGFLKKHPFIREVEKS
jgi:hypothetical protein